MRRILLDTDLAMGVPGANVDDGLALALAVADPEIEVECVTTVAGNTDVVTATRLTIELLDRLGHPEVPVHPGADELVRRVMAEPEVLTVVAIGPLTNLAAALAIEPRVAEAAVEVIVMGGVYLEQTNVAAMPGERNFWTDPRAAQAVLTSGASLRLVGLDVTRRVRLTRADTALMADAAGPGSVFAPYAAALVDDWIAYQQRARGVPEADGCAIHDPLAVAVVTRPDLVTWTPAHVAVETESALTRGVVVADLLRWQDAPVPNAEIAIAVDVDGFRDHFFSRIKHLP